MGYPGQLWFVHKHIYECVRVPRRDYFIGEQGICIMKDDLFLVISSIKQKEANFYRTRVLTSEIVGIKEGRDYIGEVNLTRSELFLPLKLSPFRDITKKLNRTDIIPIQPHWLDDKI